MKHVLAPIDFSEVSRHVLAEAEDQLLASTQNAEALLQNWASLLSPDRQKIHLRVDVGDVAECILAYADQHDLVVMGTNGRRGLGRLLVGSVAEKVVRQAACSVLVAKEPVGPTLEVVGRPGSIDTHERIEQAPTQDAGCQGIQRQPVGC